MKRERILVIDFWRVISAMSLVLYHYVCAFDTLPASRLLKPIANVGYIGVEVFFMLSGFCMALNYRDLDEKFSSYLLRRISPWYISYVCAVFLNVILQFVANVNSSFLGGVFPLDKPLSFQYLYTSLLLIHNGWFINQNSPYGSGAWFLDVLVLLYIVFYLIKRISKKKRERYIFLCFLMVIIGWYFSNTPTDFMFLYDKSARGYLMFFIGVLLYELYTTLSKESGKRISCLLCGIDFVIIIITGLFGLLLDDNVFGSFRIFMSVYFIPSLIMSSTYLLGDFKFPLSRLIVKYMTSVYIWHALVLAEIELVRIHMELTWDYSSWVTFAVVMLLIAIQCIVCFYLIEKRLTKYINCKIAKYIVFAGAENA